MINNFFLFYSQQGYIPANYIKKKFDLEIFEWV